MMYLSLNLISIVSGSLAQNRAITLLLELSDFRSINVINSCFTQSVLDLFQLGNRARTLVKVIKVAFGHFLLLTKVKFGLINSLFIAFFYLLSSSLLLINRLCKSFKMFKEVGLRHVENFRCFDFIRGLVQNVTCSSSIVTVESIESSILNSEVDDGLIVIFSDGSTKSLKVYFFYLLNIVLSFLKVNKSYNTLNMTRCYFTGKLFIHLAGFLSLILFLLKQSIFMHEV